MIFFSYETKAKYNNQIWKHRKRQVYSDLNVKHLNFQHEFLFVFTPALWSDQINHDKTVDKSGVHVTTAVAIPPTNNTHWFIYCIQNQWTMPDNLTFNNVHLLTAYLLLGNHWDMHTQMIRSSFQKHYLWPHIFSCWKISDSSIYMLSLTICT